MFLQTKDYHQIFDERGASYHSAMEHFPDAREQEFKQTLQFLKQRPGISLLDLPAGGGYLRHFLPTSTDYICAESSHVFYEFCKGRGFNTCLMQDNKIPLADQSLDQIVSVAGLHHVENKPDLFKEMKRVLKPAGQISLADVKCDSAVAHFLDEFVDEFTSTGHEGMFFDENLTTEELKTAGFSQVESQLLDYHWQFDSIEQMVWYCKRIFALDTSDETVFNGIKQYLGFEQTSTNVKMPWQLLCFYTQPGA